MGKEKAKGGIDMHYYEALLQTDFERLHPLLKKRYAEQPGKPLRITGVMHHIENGSPLLTSALKLAEPTKFMFANEGQNIPFELETNVTIEDGKYIIYWNRTFHFPNEPKFYDTEMVIDPITRQAVDYNGQGRLFGSRMDIRVTAEGALWMQSTSQFVRIGNQRMTVPKLMYVKGVALEWAEDDHICMAIDVYHEKIGRIKRYIGEYTL